MSWKVEVSKSAKRDLRKVPEQWRRAISDEMVALSQGPDLEGSILLRKRSTIHRLRVMDYRIIYKVTQGRGGNQGTIKILRVELRGPKTYRGHKNPEVKDFKAPSWLALEWDRVLNLGDMIFQVQHEIDLYEEGDYHASITTRKRYETAKRLLAKLRAAI